MEKLTIGKLAREAEVGVETIRFYERQGILAPPSRTEANYRLYATEDIARLRFIKRAKTLGFTLREIKDLLSLRQDPRATKGEIRKRTLEKIARVRAKIADLTGILAVLERLADNCDGHGPASECPILEALEGEGECDDFSGHRH